MAENITLVENMTEAELEAILKARKAQSKADREAERKARQERERAERAARVAEYRENEVEAWVGPESDCLWLALSTGWDSSVELTIHEETVPQSSILLSREDAQKLRDHLNALLG